MSATRKRGDRSVARSSYELVRATLVDPTTTRTVEPFGAAMGPHLEAASLVLPDPFDSAIVATAGTAATVDQLETQLLNGHLEPTGLQMYSLGLWEDTDFSI